jgi:triosephosphate isomerase (TIM)
MADGRPRPLVAGNWKMNGLKASTATLAAITQGYDLPLQGKVDLLVCPPATLLMDFVARAGGGPVSIGAQDCHAQPSGAFTGDISAEMVADAGGTAIIVGHSERRTLHGETDAQVRAKVEAVRRALLTPIVCVGETQAERDARKTLDVVGRQLQGSIPDGEGALAVAYEPVWAIGTGLTPTSRDVEEVHAFMRERLLARFGRDAVSVRLLYGGSVKPTNANELLSIANVNGALVGGASLVAADFLAIAAAYRD